MKTVFRNKPYYFTVQVNFKQVGERERLLIEIIKIMSLDTYQGIYQYYSFVSVS